MQTMCFHRNHKVFKMLVYFISLEIENNASHLITRKYVSKRKWWLMFPNTAIARQTRTGNESPIEVPASLEYIFATNELGWLLQTGFEEVRCNNSEPMAANWIKTLDWMQHPNTLFFNRINCGRVRSMINYTIKPNCEFENDDAHLNARKSIFSCRDWLRPSPTLRRRNLKTELYFFVSLFLGLSFPSTLIRHENGALQKRSSNRRNLKTPALRFRVDRKHFVNGGFQKTMASR